MTRKPHLARETGLHSKNSRAAIFFAVVEIAWFFQHIAIGVTKTVHVRKLRLITRPPHFRAIV